MAWNWCIGPPSQPRMAGRPFCRIAALVVQAEVAFRVEVAVGCWLAEVELVRWYPFGDALGVLAGDPAPFEQFVVGTAGEGEDVDVGAAMFGPFVDMMDFGKVPGRGAAGPQTAAILGMKV